MAFSKLDIANRALDLVGAVPLNSLDQDNDTARIINRNYDKVMLRCLRKFPWPFAVKRVQLTADVAAPVNEFANQFTLPADYVRTDEVFPKGFPYRVENNKIYHDESTIILRYVSDESVIATSRIDPGFAEYFAHELAVAIVYSLSDSVELKKILFAETKLRFNEATAISSQEFPEIIDDPGPWLNAFAWGGRDSNQWQGL